jgi:hypothetical protein
MGEDAEEVDFSKRLAEAAKLKLLRDRIEFDGILYEVVANTNAPSGVAFSENEENQKDA